MKVKEFIVKSGKYIVSGVLALLLVLGGGSATDALKIITSPEDGAAYCQSLINGKTESSAPKEVVDSVE